KGLIEQHSRIIPESYDKCPNSHIAYTGVWKYHPACPKCGLSRTIKKSKNGQAFEVSCQKYYVVPFEVPLQARWSTAEGSKLAKHRAQRTEAMSMKSCI
ncbi:hypothetical protein BT69DRAFT_1192684, partial [Atractiella rhizophila]